ncbi:MAG: CAF17-like 4Fe-4S cluster assembly/insertion protein YgfZ [Rhizomicrobium sp.]
MAHRLQDRAIIALSGPDARSFLQGLITNDVDKLATDKPLYAALLTPQGKILFDFLLADDGAGNILLDCWMPARDALVRRLSLYRLRAKVEIKPRDDLAVFASWSGGELSGIAFEDPRLPALGMRSIAAAAEGADGYLLHRLSLGVPEGPDFGSDKMFALDAGLDELHGVAFGKGCYVGQELTARMKHRGTARKRMLLVESTDKSALTAGSDLRANGHTIGEVVSVYDSRGFALVRLDRLEEAADASIDAAGVIVRVTKPHWLSA